MIMEVQILNMTSAVFYNKILMLIMTKSGDKWCLNHKYCCRQVVFRSFNNFIPPVIDYADNYYELVCDNIQFFKNFKSNKIYEFYALQISECCKIQVSEYLIYFDTEYHLCHQ